MAGLSNIRASATLPRDNVLKDFLESAEVKFTEFSSKPRIGILVVLWDGYVFEATSALCHEEAGLLTEKSWFLQDGHRVAFDAVDGVIILKHLEILKLAAQEQPCRRDDPFMIGGDGQPPNVWCPNLGCEDIDPFVSKIFDASPISALLDIADYSPKDYVMWLEAASHENRLGRSVR